MLQYMINTSIIWLACLLLYELLLRKERFHQYNRIYLIAGLGAGLLLPAANVSSLLPADNNILHRSVAQAYQIKKAVQLEQATEQPEPIKETKKTPTINAPATSGATTVFGMMYLAGVAAGIILIAREIFQLFRLYTNGSKKAERGCIVVETGEDHCPFSFFKIVFVRSRLDYNRSQWTLLIAHEKEHGRQLHSLDNLLLIILRILFWFHPLPHIYYKRLMMVHEFQADKAAAVNPVDYGTFLLEQSLLQRSPVITHSFNYSPIKNRIVMLTETKSTQAGLLKYLSVIPLSVILIFFCSQTSLSGERNRKGSKVYFKGNEIEFGSLKVIPFGYRETLQLQKDMFRYTTLPDSVLMKDPATGYMKMEHVSSETIPVVINGKPIWGNEPKYMLQDITANYIAPVVSGAVNNFDQYLFSILQKDLDQLEDGSYSLNVNRLVIDEKGNIAYYELEGICLLGQYEKKPVIRDDVRNTINQKLIEILDGSVKFKSALKNGMPVNARLSLENYQIVVKKHKAQLIEMGGC